MRPRLAGILAGCVLLLGGAPEPALHAQDSPGPEVLLPDPLLPDTSAALGKYILGQIDRFATPEFRERKMERREFQKAGYTNILHDVLGLDPVGALLSFVRTRLQIGYALPHNTIYFRTLSGGIMPLPEDWSFPADPWMK
jgi:hypothetical protein